MSESREKGKTMSDIYKVTITKTSEKREYMQIISSDQFSTNIVLIGKFEVNDQRPKGKQP